MTCNNVPASGPKGASTKDHTKWCATEEAAVVATLLSQKAAGNVSESGFRPAVWQIVVKDLAEITPEGLAKNGSPSLCHIYTSHAYFCTVGRLWYSTSLSSGLSIEGTCNKLARYLELV
jgi:hypothetical protein